MYALDTKHQVQSLNKTNKTLPSLIKAFKIQFQKMNS